MVIISSEEVTGPAKGIFQIVSSLRDRRCDFSLYNFEFQQRSPIDFINGANEYRISTNLLRQSSRLPFSVVRQALKGVKINNINIIQTHGYKPSFIGFWIKAILGIKWICFMHGTTNIDIKDNFYHIIDHVLQTFADKVVVVSKSQLKKLPRSKDVSRICIVPNAINVSQPVSFSKECPRHKTSEGDSKRPIITYIGRLSPEKGVDILLRAVALLKNSSIKTIIVGDGSEYWNLMQLAERLGLKDVVVFAGQSATPGDFIESTSVFVLPSRSEGIPNVILEAMALKKPVVATGVGGVPEIIQHEHDGLLVPPEDPRSLAAAIDRLIGDRRLAEQLADNGFQTVTRNFAVERRCESILNLYKEVLAPDGP